jgi:hypothetical protein
MDYVDATESVTLTEVKSPSPRTSGEILTVMTSRGTAADSRRGGPG